jgi:hypothetical protein
MTDDAIVDAMIRYGGSFVAALGRLWYLADPQNQARLKATFGDYWTKYRELAQLHAEQGR